MQDSYNKILKPIHNGVGIKNGISIVAFGVQATMDANPDVGCIQGNIKNRYNEVERVSVLDKIREHDSLSNTLAFSQAVMEHMPYIGMCGGTGLVTSPFKRIEGCSRAHWKADRTLQ